MLQMDHPRSRGVYRLGHPITEPVGRIIPARAGFTDWFGGGSGSAAGSSPLARGLLHRDGRRAVVEGIIPARAGFTLLGRRPHRHHPDHPRSRGVYGGEVARHGDGGGSSPLARGLPRRGRPAGGGRGIIPARAGFTRRLAAGIIGVGGSSPLARGLHTRISWVHTRMGIIPARAGFTLPH